MSERNARTSSLKRKASLNLTFAAKRAKKTSCKKLISILQKNEEDRTPNEKQMILDSNDSISVLRERLKKINAVKSRNDELEDEPDLLEKKCKELANAIQSAKHVVVYTGAGISTAAKIPDYRGTKGIWTLLQQGKDIGNHDLSLAEPTLTHMALYKLHRHGLINHVVSQNCDDLHLRSGLPRSVLSEVHGNMSVEVCAHCEPVRYYWRVFDVTEHTGRYAHQTARKCSCGEPLLDTIIHFGEKGVLLWPLNWDGANKNADKADLILCVGSSLKVLRKYGWIWGLDKPKKERPKLFIINLQWTPKDDQATLKINGKCDAVFQRVMSHLNLEIPIYDKLRDPIFYHSSHLIQQEYHTVRKPMLEIPEKDYFRDYDNSDELLDSFRKLENYQNTTVFVKEEDEIKVKEEKFVDEIKMPTIKSDPCVQGIKEEPIDSKISKRSKCHVGETLEVGIDQKCSKIEDTSDEDLKSEIQKTSKIDSKFEVDKMCDCTVNLTDVLADGQNLTELKYFLPCKINNVEKIVKMSPIEDEFKPLVKDNESSVENSALQIKRCVKKELSLKSPDCFLNLYKNDDGCERDVAGKEVKNSESSNMQRNYIKPLETKSNNDQPENKTVLESHDENLTISTSNNSTVNINALKNFRRVKKCDNNQVGIASASDSVQEAKFNLEDTHLGSVNSKSSRDTDKGSLQSNNTVSHQSERQISCSSNKVTPLSPPGSLEKQCGDNVMRDAKNETQAAPSETSPLSISPNIFKPSSVLNSSISPSVVSSASSFSTLVAKSHSKCDCRCEMDLLGSSNGTCSCDTSKTVSKPLDGSVGTAGKMEKGSLPGGISPGSIVAIVKPLLKESNAEIRFENKATGISNPCSVSKDESVKESPLPFNSIITHNISSNLNLQDNLNVNLSVSNQVIGSNLNTSQPIMQPFMPPELLPMIPSTHLVQPVIPNSNIVQPLIPNTNMLQPVIPNIPLVQPVIPNANIVQSVIPNANIVQPVIPNTNMLQPIIPNTDMFQPVIPNTNLVQPVSQPQQLLPQYQPFLQPQPILQPGQSLQQLLPFLMSGNLLSPNNMLAPPFSLASPFLTGVNNPLQTPLQILTPQIPLNLFPNQHPLIYFQPLPHQISPNLLMYPPVSTVSNVPFPLPSTISMQCPPPIQSMAQPNVTNISNISISDTYNCVQSTLDNNVLSSRPILNQVPLAVSHIPLSLTPLSEQNQVNALDQQSSTVPSNVSQSVHNVPIVDTGQSTTQEPLVTVNTSRTIINASANILGSTQNLSSPPKLILTHGLKPPEDQSSSNFSPSKEDSSSPTKSEVPNRPRLSSNSTLDSLSPSSQSLSPGQRNPITGSPLKPPHCSPRMMSPLRSPLTPLSSPLTSPLRRIRTIRPFQFKNDLAVPDDLMYCRTAVETLSASVGSNSGTEHTSERVTPSPVVMNNEPPSECSKVTTEISQSMKIVPLSRPVSCPTISNQDSTENDSRSLDEDGEDEEKPQQESEVKKRGRKPKANKEEPAAEVYHYSLPRACAFCLRNYDSGVCLFYERQDGLSLAGRRKVCCNCCSSSKETEEATASAVPTANPGWFGKGYRKNIKRKRSI